MQIRDAFMFENGWKSITWNVLEPSTVSNTFNFASDFRSKGSILLISSKSTLSGLRQFLAIESPLKMMKNAFYFISKALFILNILKFLS